MIPREDHDEPGASGHSTAGAGVQTYYLYDGLGSTTELTDANGNVTAGYGYDVFGELRSGASANPWLFTGEQRDGDSSLYYLRARYYDPAIGRFLGRDPLSGSLVNPQTQNRYPYVANNPTNWLDPTGLKILYGGEFYRGRAGDKEGSNFQSVSSSISSNDECRGNGTLEASTSVQGTFFGAAGEAGLGVGVDDSGNLGAFADAGAGGGASFPPASIAWNPINVTVTSADCLSRSRC